MFQNRDNTIVEVNPLSSMFVFQKQENSQAGQIQLGVSDNLNDDKSSLVGVVDKLNLLNNKCALLTKTQTIKQIKHFKMITFFKLRLVLSGLVFKNINIAS